MKVLQQKSQIAEARAQLVGKGLPETDSGLRSRLRRLGLVKGIGVGAFDKSWDVLETLEFLQANVGRDQPVLDIGAYASEVIVSLHKLGYTNLAGADLDPNLAEMPFADSINYRVCNFMETPFDDGSFAAITSISVIEHGFEPDRLLREMSRLLRPNGYFIASFDYWQDKIDVAGTTFFGMDWLIFSENDIRQLITRAASFGLQPVGELAFGGTDRVIHCGGKDYTFGWIAFQKSGPLP